MCLGEKTLSNQKYNKSVEVRNLVGANKQDVWFFLKINGMNWQTWIWNNYINNIYLLVSVKNMNSSFGHNIIEKKTKFQWVG